MKLSKWQALGNVYLLVEQAELTPERVRELCEGEADGVLELSGSDVKVWNADGSTAEMSGNGARIAAAWLARKTGAREIQLRVGERDVSATVDGDNVTLNVGRVDVGETETLDLDGEQVEFTPVSVGNPHAVVRDDPGDVGRLGPLVENHPRFPHRTNVQLVRVDGSHDLTVSVWERGVGETLSSGTSSVAAAGAAIANGWCESPVRVHLAGGDLIVELDESYNALLSGPVGEIVHKAKVVHPQEMRMGSPQYGQLLLDGEPVPRGEWGVEFQSLVWSDDGKRLAWQELVSWWTEPKTRVVAFDPDRRQEIAASEPHLGLLYPVRFETNALVYRKWKEWGHRRGEGELRLILPDDAANP